MQRLIYHRSDIEDILRTAALQGSALRKHGADAQYIVGYAEAMLLLASAFGCDVRIVECVLPRSKPLALPEGECVVWPTRR